MRDLAASSGWACTVEGCAEALCVTPTGTALRCTRGHAFDVARGGWVNLLPPQHKRSLLPGDSPPIVAARERLAAAGVDAALLARLAEAVGGSAWLPGDTILDVGCGCGTLAARLTALVPARVRGVDISRRAIEVAARRAPGARFAVANADRRLPVADGSLAVALTVKGPKPVDELARALRPGGRLLVVTAGTDDLLELRTQTAGRGLARDPAERALAEFAPAFHLRERTQVRECVELDAAALRDLLAIAYRGQRASEATRLDSVAAASVTLSATILDFERR